MLHKTYIISVISAAKSLAILRYIQESGLFCLLGISINIIENMSINLIRDTVILRT